MKNFKQIFSLSIMLGSIPVLFNTVTGQVNRNWCGTKVSPEQYQREVELIKSPDNPFKNLRTSPLQFANIQIPVSIFFIGKKDSTGYYDVEDYLNVMCKTNTEYHKIGIHFYLYKKPSTKKLAIDYSLNNDSLYNGNLDLQRYFGMIPIYGFINGKYNSNSMNLYRTAVITKQSPDEPGTILGRSSFPREGIYQGGIEFADYDYSTWVHEFGHFFNLYHPFQNNEDELVFRCKKVTSMEKVVIKTTNGPVISLTPKDAMCTNQKGSITTSVTGGTSPYTYSWSNGAITASLTNINGGTYYLTVTDNSGCTAIEVATIMNISGPSVTITSTEAACNLNTGKAVANVSGGTPYVSVGTSPYSYLWSNGSILSTISNLSSGLYNLTVTDSLGCKSYGMAKIISNISMPSVTLTSSPATCDSSNGSATAIVNGGKAPYQYSWSNANITSVNSGLGKGTFSLTVTDDRGCITSGSVNVNNIPVPSIQFTVTPTTCGINTNGSLSTVINGGTSPFSYSWSNNASTSVISNLSTDTTYTLTVMDANGCSLKDSAKITSVKPLSLSTTSVSSACGKNNGSSNVVVSNGSSPFIYKWSNGDTASTSSNLLAGIFYLTVTDSYGCTAIDSIVIGNVDGPAVAMTYNPATCDSSDGSATADVTGGTGPYIYGWSNGDSTSSISGLNLGTYMVTITDNKGCTTTGSVTVDQAGGPQILVTNTPENCGKNDGSVSVFVSGGLAPYNYSWNTGDSTSALSNLSAGTYYLTVTDSANCIKYGNTMLVLFGKPSLSFTATHEICNQNNGMVNAVVSGGFSPYNYLWNNGDDSSTIMNLSAGVYKISVTDNNGCLVTDSIVVNNISGPSLVLSKTNAACKNDNGTINGAVSGGVSPYIYSWSSGDSTATLSGLGVGIYTLTVSDINNCTITDSISITSDSLAISFTVTDAKCTNNNGKIISVVTGGTTPYKYSWSNGKTTGTISALSSKNYKVTVTDNKTCTLTDSVFVKFNYGPADSLLSFTKLDETCGNNNGSVTVKALSGSVPFSFSWNNGNTTDSLFNLKAGSYKVTITDTNKCAFQKTYTVGNINAPALNFTTNKATCGNPNGNSKGNATGGTAPYTYLWSTGADTNYIAGLSTGYYVLKVTDKNNCMVSDTTFVDNTMPRVTFVNTDAICEKSNGSSKATATLGTTPYSFLWSTGENTSQLKEVAGGTYFITVTDSKGCIATGSALVKKTGNPSIKTWGIDASCGKKDGSAFASVSGGKAPFTYSWSTGVTQKDTLMNISAGNYVISVTDSKGCQATALAVVNNFNSPYVSFISTNASCGNNDGAVTAVVTGGTAPYTYSWNNGANASNISNLAPGTYYVTVIDNNGCVATQTAVYYSSALEDSIACDTLMAVCGGTTVEIKKGNCETSGDLVCDTPTSEDLSIFEPAVVLSDYPGCKYIGNKQDAYCMDYSPDTHNWMDYIFNLKCLGHFTKGQVDRMWTTLLAPTIKPYTRKYLWAYNTAPEKPDTSLLRPPVLVSPSDTSLLQTTAPMVFTWRASAKGEGYIIKVFENDAEKLKRVAYDTTISIKYNFFTGNKWSFSVRPIHSNEFCNTTYSGKKDFFVTEIGDGVDETIFTPELNLFPNPVEKGEKITISLSMLNTLKTDLTVFDICGKKIECIEIPNSNYSYKVIEVDQNHFARGVYLLKFKNGLKVINRKLVVY